MAFKSVYLIVTDTKTLIETSPETKKQKWNRLNAEKSSEIAKKTAERKERETDREREWFTELIKRENFRKCKH